MSKKLFVGGLSWNTTDARLRQAFQKFGEINEAVVISDRDTGRSRGFGFVTFRDAASAKLALGEMNGASLDGRELRVDSAQEKRKSKYDERTIRGVGPAGYGRRRNW